MHLQILYDFQYKQQLFPQHINPMIFVMEKCCVFF
jgi:hypothetical protein